MSTPVGAASAKYQRTYFDVDADNALRSDLSRDWLLIGRGQVARLFGDAAASPIVKLRGSRNQSGLVLAVGRSF